MTHRSPRCPRRRVGPRAEAAVLLADDAVQRERPASRTPAVRRAATAASEATTPAFMSQAPRPCSSPPARRGTNGSPGQQRQVPGRDDVGVPGEDQRRDAVLGAGHRADDAPRLGRARPPGPGRRGRPPPRRGRSATGRRRSRARRASRRAGAGPRSRRASRRPTGRRPARTAARRSRSSSTAASTRSSAAVGCGTPAESGTRARYGYGAAVTQPPPPPGWYPDPVGQRGTRWWDGQGWTEHVQQAAAAAPAAVAAAVPARPARRCTSSRSCW